MKDKPIPTILAWMMYKHHSVKRLKEEINLIKSNLIEPGDKILDFGCGPGHLTLEMANMTGKLGMVYALDIHLLAIKKVKQLIKENGITNVETIVTAEAKTGLDNESIDMVFIINTFGMVRDKKTLIDEVDRVLKTGGKLLIRNKMRLKKKVDAYKKIFSNSSLDFIKLEEKTYYFQKK